MTDEQFKDFIKNFNSVIDQKFLTFKDEIRAELKEELTDIRNNIDWLVDATNTDENERLALSSQIDRRHDNHERRLAALELTPTK